MPHEILVVDDSTSMRQILEATLVHAGYRVSVAADGQQALHKAIAAVSSPSGPFRLILTDHNMPQMTGLELIRALREVNAYVSSPILILTTEDGEQFKNAARDAGASGWLLKPLDPPTLTDVVAALLEPQRA